MTQKIIHKFRSLVFYILYFLRLGLLLKFINIYRQKVPVLLFHRISDNYDPFTHPHSLYQFKLLMKFLNKNYDLRSLDDLFTLDKTKLKNSCFIVFDDALFDFYENAWPIIKEFQIPVTLFVPTDPVDKTKIYWSLEFLEIFISTDYNNINQIHYFHDNMINKIRLTKGDRIKKINQVHNVLMMKSSKDRTIAINLIKDSVVHKSSVSVFQMMSWNNIMKLLNDDINILNIQSHSKTHEFLPILNTNDLEREYRQSKNDIINNLNISPIAISYPFGGYNNMVIEVARKYYDYGFITDNKLLNLDQIHNDQCNMKLSRINVTDRSPWELYLRINGFHYFIIKIIQKFIRNGDSINPKNSNIEK